jgi:hypothetical protein
MKRRKPRGTNGPVRLTSGELPAFMPVEHPDEKDAIERRIMVGAVGAAKAQSIPLYELVSEPIQNEENHFDFTLPTDTGNEFVDLVEVVLPGGYRQAAASYGVGAFADHMFSLVKKKALKYGMRRRSNIHLLLYSTDWKFIPSESVVALLTLYCFRRPHGFKTVAVVAPIDSDSAILWRAFPPFPSAAVIPTIDEKSLRKRVLHQGNPLGVVPTADGKGFHWTFPEQSGPPAV